MSPKIDLDELTGEQWRLLRSWFYANAYIPQLLSLAAHPDEAATRDFRSHIDGGCALSWKRDPGYNPVIGYRPKLEGGRQVADYETGRPNWGLRAIISCACGRYDRLGGASGPFWFIPESRSALDIVLGRTLEKKVAEALRAAGGSDV